MDSVISVIIPIYNMEAYLARCLDSVINNTYRNLEIICIDDGSKDGSLEILRQYEKKDSRIVVIAKENGGVSSARNAGLDRMTGEFVVFIDPDDFVHPQFFELMLQAQQETGADYVMGRFQKVTDEDLPVHYEHNVFTSEAVSCITRKQLFRGVDYRRYCTIRLIRTAPIGALRFRTGMPYGEDTTFVAELWEQAPWMKACDIPFQIYYYYQRTASASNVSGEQKKLGMLRLFSEKASLSTLNEEIYLDHVIRFSVTSRETVLYLSPDKKTAKAFRDILKKQIPLLRRTSTYSKKEKLAMLLFIRFPILHLLYRAKKEPGFLHWVRTERKKRRQRPNNGTRPK